MTQRVVEIDNTIKLLRAEKRKLMADEAREDEITQWEEAQARTDMCEWDQKLLIAYEIARKFSLRIHTKPLRGRCWSDSLGEFVPYDYYNESTDTLAAMFDEVPGCREYAERYPCQFVTAYKWYPIGASCEWHLATILQWRHGGSSPEWARHVSRALSAIERGGIGNYLAWSAEARALRSEIAALEAGGGTDA